SGSRTTPVLQSPCHLSFAQLDLELPAVDIDHDWVAIAERGDRTASRCLGCNMADHQAMGCTGEAAVGDECNRIAQAFADKRAGHAEHLAHPGTTDRTFVANHHDVAGLDLPGAHRGKGRLFTVEHPSRAEMLQPFMAG